MAPLRSRCCAGSKGDDVADTAADAAAAAAHTSSEQTRSISAVTMGSASGIFVFITFAFLVYANVVIWEYYLTGIFWAFLLSQALRPLKKSIINVSLAWKEENKHEESRRAITLRVVDVVLALFGALARCVWYRGNGYDSRGTNEGEEAKKGEHFQRGKRTKRFQAAYFFDQFLNKSFLIFSAVLLLVFAGKFFNPLWLLCILTACASLGVAVCSLFETVVLRAFSSNAFVTYFLIVGVSILTLSIISILGVASVLEAIEACMDMYQWVWTSLQSNNEIVENWVSNMTTFAYAQYQEQVQATYNQSEWWPAVAEIEDAVFSRRGNVREAVYSSWEFLGYLYGEEAWWDPLDSVVSVMLRQKGTAQDQAMGFLAEIFSLDYLYDNVSSFHLIWQSLTSNISGVMLSLPRILLTVLNSIASIGNYSYILMGFFLFLRDFTIAELNMLKVLVDAFVPATKNTRAKIHSRLQLVISHVFFMPTCRASLHALIVFTMGALSGARFTFFASLMSFLVSFLGFSAVIIPAIWAGISATSFFSGLETLPSDHSNTQGLKMMIFSLLCLYLSMRGDALIMDSKRFKGAESPLLTVFAMVLGFYSIGISGVFLGPLALGLLMTAIKMRIESLEQEDLFSSSPKEGKPVPVNIQDESSSNKKEGSVCQEITPITSDSAETGAARHNHQGLRNRRQVQKGKKGHRGSGDKEISK